MRPFLILPCFPYLRLMLTLYGIKTCDTMQKAFKWLDAKKIKYHFHDYREVGIDKATIENWFKHLPVDKVINLRSTTFKELPEQDKASITDKAKAVSLIIKSPTIVKRPLWDLGNNKFYLGWNEKEVSGLL